MEAKPLFAERMQKLLGNEYNIFTETNKKKSPVYIRCNTLKIFPADLKEKLLKKGWKIKQPYFDYPEIMLIESKINPGEIGNAEEHIFGYYYSQELTSMMPAIALNPSKDDAILDLCASPGSKTTQISAMMNNRGILISNDKGSDRMKILTINIERCGISNEIVIQSDAVQLCQKLEKQGYKFDKILLDAPCSGEGNIRKDKKTLKIWNIKTIKRISRMQKKMIACAASLLKPNGILVYSTCTHAPEECESVVSFAAQNFNLNIEKVNLPIKHRNGIKEWENEKFADNIENCVRIYPQDNDSEGFFLARLRKQ